MPSPLTTSLPPAGHTPATPDAQDALHTLVWGERARMLSAPVYNMTAVAAILALSMASLMWHAGADAFRVIPWLALRLLILWPRLVHARAQRQAGARFSPRAYRRLHVLVLVDGLLWGATWWWLVPPDRMDLMAVAVATVLGVAAMSAFMLQADARLVAWHVLPVLLPNAVYALTRLDAQGLFGAISLSTFAILLVMEARRAQSRLVELLTLRFRHEGVLREREHALALAQHHSEAKSRFLASMSHEMRTPLHGILGLARLLDDDESRPIAQRRLALLSRSGEHLLTVINDVLDVSKIEAGHMQIRQQPFDLASLIDDVAGVSTVTAQRKGLALHVHTHVPPGHHVLGDAMRVRQILHNLLGNAIKFTDQGCVTLTVQHQPDLGRITLVVQDTGIGIPASEQAHIFEAFHQVVHPGGKRHAGTGLGLTISRQLCLAMGGDLRYIARQSPGSTFECTLSLPATAAPARVASAPAFEASPCPDACKVLLVEDNLVNAMVAEAALLQIGAQVQILEDGSKAVAWLAEHRVDLVLMDCQMPVMDGLEATRRIREREHRLGQAPVPIVALTANVFATERQRCIDAGMDDYLGKPFRREDLLAVLVQHTARRSAQAGMAA